MTTLTQELKKEYQRYNLDALNDVFIVACKQGQLNVVKYLLTSPELKKHADIHAKNDYGFQLACQYGHLEIVKYLLTSLELTSHAYIHAHDNFAFVSACKNGHFEVVKYLLTSPDLKEHAYIYADNQKGFLWACKNDDLNLAKYLLTSPDLKKHIDIHDMDDYGFQLACLNKSLNVILYLLSFDGKQCIDFQRTEFNLDWAIANKHNNVIVAMMNNLKNNNVLDYIACLDKVKAYDPIMYEQIKDPEIENSINNVNSTYSI